MENPLISVIVPIYKVEKYLSRCIDSIIGQTYTNLEIILVDDGSPDNCGKMCDKYSVQDKRIIVIHKANGGLSDARNAGIKIANGKYIAFIDSDDGVSTKYFEILYSLIKSYSADISLCSFVKTYNIDRFSVENVNSKIFVYTNIEALEEYFTVYYPQMVVAWGKLYKAGLFQHVRFPLGKVHEDEYTTYRLLYLSNKIVFTTEKLYYYLQTENSITREESQFNHRMQYLDALKERIDFFAKVKQEDLKNKTVRRYFTTLVSTYGDLTQGKNYIESQKIKDRILLLKNYILHGESSKPCKIFYRLFLLMPNQAFALLKIMKKINHSAGRIL